MTDKRHGLVQAIAVVPGSHEETVAAVAIAATLAALEGEQPQRWEAWFDQAFTKSVRKIRRPAQESKIAEDPLMRARHSIGGARAYAYVPLAYEEFPKHLSSLHVSGLDRDRTEESCGANGPLVIVNSAVEMSTGKTAAQVAHALMLWALTLSDEEADRWKLDPAVRVISGQLDALDADTSFTIRDSGLTEIDPGTETVRIRRP